MASERSNSPGGPGNGTLFDFGAMLEAMEVARRNWSSFSLPASLTPTLDPAELDKRIADLKTVEQWLSLNLNLLRGSIQALEMQRATLSSLQEFGAAAQAATQAASEASLRAGQAATDRTAAPDGPGDRAADGTSGQGSDAAAHPAGAWPGADAGAWWQMLQSQFRQVTESAMAGLQPGNIPSPPEQAIKPGAATRTKRAQGEAARPARSGKGRGTRSTGTRNTPARPGRS